MQKMSPDEARAFLLAVPRTGKISTVRADGRPHVAPIWFDFDGETLVFTSWHTSVKSNNIRRDPRIAMCVDDDKLPYAYVIVEGEAEIADVSAEERVYWATRIARRYVGDDLAEQFGKRNGVEGELILRARVTRFVAHTGIAD